MALKAGYKGLKKKEDIDKIKKLIEKLTCTETEDGSYVLTATVDDGKVTYSYEATT